MSAIPIRIASMSSTSTQSLLRLLEECRGIKLRVSAESDHDLLPDQALPKQLQNLSSVLVKLSRPKEAEVLQDVYSHIESPTDFGGLGLDGTQETSSEEDAEILFLVSAYLQALNSVERSKKPAALLKERPPGRRGMTLSEKIFASHDIERRGWIKPGDVVVVEVDWVMASELSWYGMEKTYNALGKPGIFRNDRFWLAGDHVVDPRIKDAPKVKAMVDSSERARQVFKMTENQGMNYTIMHTEFARERAQPGTLVVGSDSHTCSAGSLGSLAIGLGTADVTMPLITGETWFRIPESVSIKFVGKPSPGIGGKDVILYILQQLKRNTVAAERVVEFSGPGLKHLSIDARFAIANMCTEFGGVSGIFVPDEITKDYIERRKSPKHKTGSTYFRPDDDAEYAETHTIDLTKVESFIARYPSPDDVVPVSELEGTALDGCFIGACTTAEEDLILAALALEAGLKIGKTPVKNFKRKVVPGSLPIRNKLDRLGLTEIYRKAGFEVGIPGCSYCVGLAADKASQGETWLSSQNRNFENRMGPGSIGHITSAATVAASSFDMRITNPLSLLDAIDPQRLADCLVNGKSTAKKASPQYYEPGFDASEDVAEDAGMSETYSTDADSLSKAIETVSVSPTTDVSSAALFGSAGDMASPSSIKKGKLQRLGDFVDTDALAPNEALATASGQEEWAEFCLKYTYPEFRQKAKEGYNIVVAGAAFGCGSSREVAVTALLGCKIQVVIAKSFAFIYGRNQPNLGLLGIVMTDPAFYEVATDGAEIAVDLDNLKIDILTDDGVKTFPFQISAMERQLFECGGITDAWKKWGRTLWKEMCQGPGRAPPRKAEPLESIKKDLQW